MVIDVWNCQCLQLFIILLRIMVSKEIAEYLEICTIVCPPLVVLISMPSASVWQFIYISSCSWVPCHIALTPNSLYCSHECSHKCHKSPPAKDMRKEICKYRNCLKIISRSPMVSFQYLKALG